MSVIIDTTMSEVESVIKYARYGANNCMIANSWEVTELVRCQDCVHCSENGGEDCPIEKHHPIQMRGFCHLGERRTEE